jgi:aldose 1-epimerase
MNEAATRYSAQKLTVDGIEIVRLTDTTKKAELSVVASLGNNPYSFKVNGKEVFWSPYKSLAEFKAKPTQLGNPFLAPWANRIDQTSYYANGAKYNLNPDLKNYRGDGFGQPIHGLVVFAEWEVIKVHADAKGAAVTSRLEFWKHPKWMAQFPFAHTLEMTYRLQDGIVQCETYIVNHSHEPMPVSIAFHGYYQITDAPREKWKLRSSASEQVVLNEKLTPTGAKKANPYPSPMELGKVSLDDVFTTLNRNADGRAEFSIEGTQQKITVLFGEKYPVSVIYAPPGRNFICFEPMTAITNAFNLSQANKYKGLQSIPAQGDWRESFWIIPSGF